MTEPTLIGDNSLTPGAGPRIKEFVERAERIGEDIANLKADLKEIFEEAKGQNFDVKMIRKIIKLRAEDPAKREEEEAMLALYISAIGGL
jgi:uncharacterized protein (UPF0335 family)